MSSRVKYLCSPSQTITTWTITILLLLFVPSYNTADQCLGIWDGRLESGVKVLGIPLVLKTETS